MPFLHGIEVLQIDSGPRPIRAVASSVIGVIGTAPTADASKFPLDTPVLITTAAQAAPLTATLANGAAAGAEGTLPLAIADIVDQCRAPIVAIRVEEAAAGAGQLAAQLTSVTGAAASSTGVYGFLAAESLLGIRPRILCAPGHTGPRVAGAANPVVGAYKGIAAKLRAVAIVDGPNDTDAAAIAKATQDGDSRVYLVDPQVKVQTRTGIVNRPASGRVAGVLARTDEERGFWWSLSNQPVYGVLGLSRVTDFAISQTGSGVNLLNEAGVGTIINYGGGYRTWGNRTKSADQAWQFLSVRRTADLIYDAIERAYLWAIDRPQSGQLLQDVLGSVEDYLRRLKGEGAILGGRAWLDPELNTALSLADGQLFINFDIEPPAPLERLTFRAHRNAGYYSEVVESVLATAA